MFALQTHAKQEAAWYAGSVPLPPGSTEQHMRAAILDGTLWLCFQARETARREVLPIPQATLTRHIMDLHEIHQVAILFGEDVPTLLSKTFHVDVHAAWRELTEPQKLCSN